MTFSSTLNDRESILLGSMVFTTEDAPSKGETLIGCELKTSCLDINALLLGDCGGDSDCSSFTDDACEGEFVRRDRRLRRGLVEVVVDMFCRRRQDAVVEGH